jgi:hypothetical protein
VHIPSDGKPMSGYAAAYAELQRSGGSVGGFVGGGEDDAGAPASGFSIASLFGGGVATSSKSGDTPQAIILADARKRSGFTQSPLLASATPAAQPTEPAKAEPAVAEAKPAAAEAKTAPVVVASADIPLPERRPAELSGPALVWQTGPAAQAASASDVPLPPSRPDVGTAAPTVLAALDNSSASDVPTPMVRPQAPVFAEAARGFDALLRRGEPTPPAAALGYAAADTPLRAQAEPVERVALVATRFERLDFASVAAPIDSPHDPAQAGLMRPDLNSVGTLIPKPAKMVVMRFGVAAYHDLRSGRFAGAAIRPLRTASFVTQPSLFSGALASN